MSTLKVEICRIDGVEKHPNADRLDIVKIAGWQCVTQKDAFKVGDSCVYIPIDSILPLEVESKIFGPDSKIKLDKSRVRSIKLRGAISQGMAVRPSTLGIPDDQDVGTDVSEILGIKKYEPPTREVSHNSQLNPKPKRSCNPNFKKYTGIENWKWYPTLFDSTEEVVVTEKIHGTNFRCGYIPYCANTWWKKVLKFLHLTPQYEFVYGSHNVQLQNKLRYKGYYSNNVYLKIAKQYNLESVLKNFPGFVVYGEIYGDRIQKGYNYGCGTGEHKLVVFDVMHDGSYLDFPVFSVFCNLRRLPMAPVVYHGPYDGDKILSLTKGNSVLCPEQRVREGVVVKPLKEQITFMGRKILKVISDDYLLNNDNTDFH